MRLDEIKRIAYKLLGDNYTILALKRRDWQTYLYSVFRPYCYVSERYKGTFLEESAMFPYDDSVKNKVDRMIYVFWTGNNEITPNRLAGIKSLEKVSRVEIKLITLQNLKDYIVDEDPIPDAYNYLSLNHRSDFLRGYFMYHYGGGYADIKTYYNSWIPAFEQLDNSKDAYVVGYPEVGIEGVANKGIVNDNIRKDLKLYWRLLIGNGAFICRPYTRFTAEWYSEARRRLLVNAKYLEKSPAKDFFGTNSDYPLSWASMQGEIFHPFCLKYHKYLLKNKALIPSFTNYR